MSIDIIQVQEWVESLTRPHAGFMLQNVDLNELDICLFLIKHYYILQMLLLLTNGC